MIVTITSVLLLMPFSVITKTTEHHSKSHLAVKQVPKRPRPIATDTSNFKELVMNSDVFVDKTLIVEKLLKTTGKMILLNLPKTWGKSINLDMLKTFLEIEVDRDGNKILPHTASPNYRLFKNGEIILSNGAVERLREPLLISKCKMSFDLYQGRYPVIYLKLGNINGSDYVHVMDIIRTRISDAYRDHVYVINAMRKIINDSNRTWQLRNETEKYLKIFEETLQKQIDPNEWAHSIAVLSEILYSFYGQRVFILLDDWDGVLYNMIFDARVSNHHTRRITTFYTSFMQYTFKTNNYFEKSVFTGSFRGLDLIPCLDVVKDYHAVTSVFYLMFGFNKEEVVELFDHFQIPNDTLAKAQQWYNGYHRRDENLYNPRSIANFVCDKEFKNYRIQRYHVTNHLMEINFKHKEFRDIVLALLNEYEISVAYQYLEYKYTFEFAEKYRINPTGVDEDTKFVIWSYLYDAGYLTGCDKTCRYELKSYIVNEEVKNELLTMLMTFYINRFNISSQILEQAVDNLAAFIVSDDPTSEPLQNVLETLINILPRRLIGFVMQFISSQITMRYDFRSQDPEFKEADKRPRKPTVSILYTMNRGIVIKAELDAESTESILNNAKQVVHSLQNITTIKVIKYVAINVVSKNEDKNINEVHISAIPQELNHH